MNKKTQLGFAHLMIITVILGLGLVGALGYALYRNLNQKQGDVIINPPALNSNNKISVKKVVTYKTYTTEKYGISFDYPSDWTLGEVEVPYASTPYLNRSIEVKNKDGEFMAKLTLGVDGLGGACPEDSSQYSLFSVIDTEPSSIKAKKAVTMSFVVTPSIDKLSYNAYYGLTDTYTTKGDSRVCLFYNLFASEITGVEGNYGSYEISFGYGVTSYNGKRFTSLDDAKKYISSDEYKEIKKMVLSLRY